MQIILLIVKRDIWKKSMRFLSFVPVHFQECTIDIQKRIEEENQIKTRSMAAEGISDCS